jgi:hypothetical protein
MAQMGDNYTNNSTQNPITIPAMPPPFRPLLVGESLNDEGDPGFCIQSK